VSLLNAKGEAINPLTLLDVGRVCSTDFELLPVVEALSRMNSVVNPRVLVRRVSRLVDQNGRKIYLEDK
jgi:hypothetical protein